MRLVRFCGAMSLDGYIAGPDGEYDWIVMDPDIDFAGILKEFDTFLIGRKTFEAMVRMGNDAKSMPGIQNIVFVAYVESERLPARHHEVRRGACDHRAPREAGQGHCCEAWWVSLKSADPLGRGGSRNSSHLAGSKEAVGGNP
jgi:hypothetical protein